MVGRLAQIDDLDDSVRFFDLEVQTGGQNDNELTGTDVLIVFDVDLTLNPKNQVPNRKYEPLNPIYDAANPKFEP